MTEAEFALQRASDEIVRAETVEVLARSDYDAAKRAVWRAYAAWHRAARHVMDERGNLGGPGDP